MAKNRRVTQFAQRISFKWHIDCTNALCVRRFHPARDEMTGTKQAVVWHIGRESL